MFIPHVNRAKIINLIYRQNIGNQMENRYICFSVSVKEDRLQSAVYRW